MLPHRFQRIRNIQFSTAFQCPVRPGTMHNATRYLPDDATAWVAACEVLSSMESLERLQITIALWSPNPCRRNGNDNDSMMAVLTPLCSIRASVFTVVITEPLTDEVRNSLGEVPFQITQRSRPGIGFYSSASDD